MIAEALAAACSDPDVLARIGGPLGDAARASAAELRRLPESARKRQRAQLAAAARAVLPPGMRGIHPTWIEAALAALPPRARADLAAGGAPAGGFDAVAVWLARWAAASLVPVPAADVTRPRTIHDVPRMAAGDLVTWLTDVGADQLAFALGPAAARLVAHAVDRIGRAPRVNRLGTRRAAIERCRLDLTAEAPLLIGARAVAPYTDAIVRRQIALRLPRTRGSTVLAELAAWARDAIETAPTWDALAAAP